MGETRQGITCRAVWLGRTVYLSSLLVVLLFLAFTNLPSLIMKPDLRPAWTFFTSVKADHPSPDQDQDKPLIVHYVYFHVDLNPLPNVSISFVECLSILSVMKELAPDAIYFHTNVPNHYPFNACNTSITDWSLLKIIPITRRLFMNGHRIDHIKHEADIRKVEAVMLYGGLVLDLDVLIINGPEIRQLLAQYPCLMCRDYYPETLNLGFFGCRRRQAEFAQLVFNRSYVEDYNPHYWLHNSGTRTWELQDQFNATVHVVEGVCNVYWTLTNDSDPAWTVRGRNWSDMVAYHTYDHHDQELTETKLQVEDSTFADLLIWIWQS